MSSPVHQWSPEDRIATASKSSRLRSPSVISRRSLISAAFWALWISGPAQRDEDASALLTNVSGSHGSGYARRSCRPVRHNCRSLVSIHSYFKNDRSFCQCRSAALRGRGQDGWFARNSSLRPPRTRCAPGGRSSARCAIGSRDAQRVFAVKISYLVFRYLVVWTKPRWYGFGPSR